MYDLLIAQINENSASYRFGQLLGALIVGSVVLLVVVKILKGARSSGSSPASVGSSPPAPAMTPVQAVAAGWYPDPASAGQQRYWDGQQWTEHTTETGS